MDESFVSVAPVGGEDVRPYRIHVSSKYLDLTKKKLEVTRLPHDLQLEKGREWELGTPKSIVEPLIDYWLEYYDWRAQEAKYNAELPQFRLAITPPEPAPQVSLRIHFIHIRSSSPSAIPLLVIPSFPFTNISHAPLLAHLTAPADGGQAYHIVCPSLPGLGFSDAFTSAPFQSTFLSTTASLFNTLMQTLGYSTYIATGTSSAASSPGNIDYHLPRLLAEEHESCKGVHLIDPVIPEPKLAKHPRSWMKYSVARFFHAQIFGYTAQDWKAATRTPATPVTAPPTPANELDLEAGGLAPNKKPAWSGTASAFLRRPFFPPQPAHTPLYQQPQSHSYLALPTALTLAYSLCDSPTGLISLALLGLQKLAANHNLSEAEIITIVQLAWLPGPEGALRFWSGAEAEIRRTGDEAPKSRAEVAITSFAESLGEGGHGGSWTTPVWAETRFEVASLSRKDGVAGLPWDNAEIILEGVRALSTAVWKAEEPAADGKGVGETVELQEVVSPTLNPPRTPDLSRTGTRESSGDRRERARGEEVIVEVPEPESPDLTETLPVRPPLKEEIGSSETVVATTSDLEVDKVDKGKGKAGAY